VRRQIALDEVQVGAADRADVHFDPDLPRPEPGCASTASAHD
jgi:hypothetical protein